MKKCWLLQIKMREPETGETLVACWRIRREWFWLDALDVINKDIADRAASYPKMVYDLVDIKEV